MCVQKNVTVLVEFHDLFIFKSKKSFHPKKVFILEKFSCREQIHNCQGYRIEGEKTLLLLLHRPHLFVCVFKTCVV